MLYYFEKVFACQARQFAGDTFLGITFTTGHFLGNTEFHRDFTEVHGELMRKTVFGVKLIPLFNISG
jgi:hypothetical protein